MARPDRFMPLEIEPWTKKTARLSAAARGAYMDLLLAYWQGEELPANDDEALMRLARCTEREWKEVGSKVLAFFYRDGDLLGQVRADEEKAKAKQRYEQKASSGKAGGEASGKQRRSKPEAEPPADPPAKGQRKRTHLEHLEQSPTGDIHPSDDASASLKVKVFGPCLEFLKTATGKTDKETRTLLGKWCSEHGDAKTIQAVVEAQRNSPLEPIAYIEKVLRNAQTAAVKADAIPVATEESQWRARCLNYTPSKFWNKDQWGPRPGEPGCRVPAQIISELNLDGLTPPNHLRRTA